MQLLSSLRYITRAIGAVSTKICTAVYHCYVIIDHDIFFRPQFFPISSGSSSPGVVCHTSDTEGAFVRVAGRGSVRILDESRAEIGSLRLAGLAVDGLAPKTCTPIMEYVARALHNYRAPVRCKPEAPSPKPLNPKQGHFGTSKTQARAGTRSTVPGHEAFQNQGRNS